MNLHSLTRKWKMTQYKKKTSCKGVFEVSSPKCLKVHRKRALNCLTVGQNHKKSMTIWKLCEKSSKWDVAGHCSFICLEMAKVWRKKSLIEKNAHFMFFQWTILVFPFLTMMQLKIILATLYPWANWRASNFLQNGAKNKFLTQCV